VLELDSLARISTLQKPDLTMLAFSGMVATLALLILAVLFLRVGFSALSVAVLTLGTFVVGATLARRVARTRHFLIETWGGLSVPIMFESPSTEEVVNFVELVREISQTHLDRNSIMMDVRPPSLALADNGNEEGTGLGHPRKIDLTPLEAVGPSVREELDRQARLLESQFLTHEEFALRKKLLLDFHDSSSSPGENFPIH